MVTAFQLVPDPMTRYKQLLFYATRLKALPEALHTAENKVQGCVSQVWVVSELRAGAVYFQADSDSQLTKARRMRSERVAPAPDARLKGARGAASGRPQWLRARGGPARLAGFHRAAGAEAEPHAVAQQRASALSSLSLFR